ncbi:MobA/MobL family protein [Bifidobacterium longum]|uniref:MobA/MobL family protein n=1 Tax=Bifidobacterium longum TaxID=216816 RepID=UPI002378D19A|nr:MobA/MobL family protein [Bifidobacterium longum]
MGRLLQRPAPGYAVIDHRSFKARGIERIPTIHEGYASREMEKRGGRGDPSARRTGASRP